MRDLFPEELKQILKMIEALNEVDGLDNDSVSFASNIKVCDTFGELIGHLVDEVGGAWAFRPIDSKDSNA